MAGLKNVYHVRHRFYCSGALALRNLREKQRSCVCLDEADSGVWSGGCLVVGVEAEGYIGGISPVPPPPPPPP